jgi:arylsulfatase A-like enzyme
MNHFMKHNLLILGSAVLFATGACEADTPKPMPTAARPNFIFFIVDDMERYMANFLPGQQGKCLTPNLDRLAREGTVMDGMHCVSPLCTPSRYNSLTGRYASRARNAGFLAETRSRDGQAYVEFNSFITKDDVTLPKLLQKAGYKTGMVGKNHVVEVKGLKRFPNFDASAKDPRNVAQLKANYDRICQAVREAGFDYAASVYDNNPDFLGLGEIAVQNMDWITKGGLDFIDQFHHEPFYLYFATTVPHAPSEAKRSWDADPLITAEGYLDKPLEVQPPRHTIPERLTKAGIPVTDWAANILWVDDAIGALIARLEKYNLMKNTIIIVFNDNGQAAKGTLYQGGVENPLCVIWKHGGFKCGSRNSVKSSNVDFVPTLLDLANVTVPSSQFDGRSLLPALNGAAMEDRSLYFELGYARAVSKGKWKYLAVRYPEELQRMSLEERTRVLEEWNAERRRKHLRIVTTDPTQSFSHLTAIPGGGDAERSSTGKYPGYYDADQLYDLENDPKELNNLAKQPEFAAKLVEMKAELKRCLDGLPGKFGELKPKTETDPVKVANDTSRFK